MLVVGRRRGRSQGPLLSVRLTRERYAKVVLSYAEEAGSIGADAELDRLAAIRAIDRAGYTRAVTDKAKLRKFKAIWGSDAARALLYETWGFAVPEASDPLAVMQRAVYEHIVQEDGSWGERDRTVSLAAVDRAMRMFVPTQTHKIDQRRVVVTVDRPAEPGGPKPMSARNILPAGQTLVGPQPSVPEDGDEEDD